jgi:hypothetical protein
MEEESRPANVAVSPQQQLRQLLTATYRSRTPTDARNAQTALVQGFQTAGFVDQVASVIIGTEEGTRIPTQST